MAVDRPWTLVLYHRYIHKENKTTIRKYPYWLRPLYYRIRRFGNSVPLEALIRRPQTEPNSTSMDAAQETIECLISFDVLSEEDAHFRVGGESAFYKP